MSRSAIGSRHAPPPSGADWGLIALLAALWASSFPLAEVALWSLPPLSVVAGRVGIGALTLVVLLRLRGLALPRRPAALGGLLVMGLLNNALPFSLIVWASSRSTAASPRSSMRRRRCSPCSWRIC